MRKHTSKIIVKLIKDDSYWFKKFNYIDPNGLKISACEKWFFAFVSGPYYSRPWRILPTKRTLVPTPTTCVTRSGRRLCPIGEVCLDLKNAPSGIINDNHWVMSIPWHVTCIFPILDKVYFIDHNLKHIFVYLFTSTTFIYSNCGIRQPEYGDKKVHVQNQRKRGINVLINIMSRSQNLLGCDYFL